MFDHYLIPPRQWAPLRGLNKTVITLLEQGKVVSLSSQLNVSTVYEREEWRRSATLPHAIAIAAGTVVDTTRALQNQMRVLIWTTRANMASAWVAIKRDRKGDLDTTAVRSIRKHFTKAGWPAALSPSGLPWEIVLIEDPTARSEALTSYLSAM